MALKSRVDFAFGRSAVTCSPTSPICHAVHGVCCSPWGHAHAGASGRLGIGCMDIGMIPRVFAFRTQGMHMLLRRWAAQDELIGPVGEPVFRTTKAMFDDFRQWVADDASKVACDEVITHARVKAILDTLYSDQLHRGDRNGLQHKKGPGNHDLWNFTDIDPSRQQRLGRRPIRTRDRQAGFCDARHHL